MSLSLSEIKELITFGQQIGLTQMSAAGVSVVYGIQQAPAVFQPGTTQDEAAELLAQYSAKGREMLRSRT